MTQLAILCIAVVALGVYFLFALVSKLLSSTDKQVSTESTPVLRAEDCPFYLEHPRERRLVDAKVITEAEMSHCDNSACPECFPIRWASKNNQHKALRNMAVSSINELRKPVPSNTPENTIIPPKQTYYWRSNLIDVAPPSWVPSNAWIAHIDSNDFFGDGNLCPEFHLYSIRWVWYENGKKFDALQSVSAQEPLFEDCW